MRRILTSAVLGLVLASGLAGAGHFGPPGICNTIECGDAKSGLDSAWAGITAKNLADRLPAVLDQFSGNSITRMEALRRAVFLEGSLGDDIAGVLALRALEQDAAGSKTAPAALFDVGYAIHVYKTMGSDTLQHRAEADGIAGYALVKRAIEQGGDAGMHVGAAYMTLPAMQPRNEARVAKARDLFKAHAEAALKACLPGSVEEKNLEFVLGFENDKADAIRARLTKK